jgi:hypothetical protein
VEEKSGEIMATENEEFEFRLRLEQENGKKTEPIYKTKEEGMSALAKAKAKQGVLAKKAGALQTATDVAAVPYHFANQLAFNAPRALSNTMMPGAGEAMARAGGIPAGLAGVAGGVLSPLNKFMLFQKAGLGAKALAGAAQGAIYSPNEDIVGLKQRSVQAGVGAALAPATKLVSDPIGRFLSTNVQKAERALRKAARIYREVLKPKQSEVRKIEIGRGRNIDDFYKLAAKEGLIIEPDVNGTINTETARGQLSEKVNALNKQLDDILATDTSKKFNLDDIARKAKVSINEKFKSAIERKSARKKIDEIIKAEKNDAKGNMVSGEQLNKIKEAMWGMGYNQLEPNTDVIARNIGHVIKDAIESGYSDKAIKELNKIRGDYLTLNSLLVNAHSRPINYGHMGKMVASGVGAIAGRHIPFVGPFIGSHIGKTAVEAAANPERVSRTAASLATKYSGPESKFMEFLRKTLNPTYGTMPRGMLRNPSGVIDGNPNLAPREGAVKNAPKTRPEDFDSAKAYVASKLKPSTMKLKDIDSSREWDMPDRYNQTVREMVESLVEGKGLPPIQVSSKGILQDGRHRLVAYKRFKELGGELEDIPVVIGEHTPGSEGYKAWKAQLESEWQKAHDAAKRGNK